MREIKFRAWDGKELWQVERIDFCMTDGMQRSIYSVKRKLEIESYGYLAVTLMQYTGLKDKNGVEIYEGDIYRYGRFALNDSKFGPEPWDNMPDGITENDITTEHRRFEVKWDFAMLLSLQKQIEDNPDVDGVEVIGNIYQNPELAPA